MQDFAFIQLPTGRYLCGLGPFDARGSLSHDTPTAFYRNNFDLSDPAPWKVPTEAFNIPASDLPDLLLAGNGSTPLPEISWSGLDDRDVRSIFDDILAEIAAGTLEKSVPVLTEKGILHRGEPAALVKAVAAAPKELLGYGYREGGRGMMGVTPERLISVQGGKLETMALAGTAPRHEAGDFPKDPKEIREHELVADYLEDLLTPLGRVVRGERTVMDLGPIVHFLTKIRVSLKGPRVEIDELIRLTHPTPALGACPRGEGALLKLVEYRDRMGVPEGFGAPFGVWHEGRFDSLVAIRSVLWDGREVDLPSGVGLVRGSRFDREWRELALKRNSVKSLLGV